VIFGYNNEDIGVEAAQMACDIVEGMKAGRQLSSLDQNKEVLVKMSARREMGPSTGSIVNAAAKRNIPYRKIAGGYILLGQGKKQKRIAASITENTSNISVDIAGNKETTKNLLADAMIPVPQGVLLRNEEGLENVAKRLGFPLVIKPLDGHQGKGITSDITEYETLFAAFKLAKQFSNSVIIEKHIKGNDYRFLVVGNKFIAASKRTPACVTGDGVSTIQQLIDEVNKDPRRGEGHGKVLTKILVDDNTRDLLASKQMSVNTVPEKGVCVYLKDTANLSTGGTAEDVTDIVHPDNILLAERTAMIIGLDVCGIDIMATDVSTPIAANGGAVLEVNAAPGLRMHIAPAEGTPRNVGDPIVDQLFPNGSDGRIPIIAVTGTNGKTTTSRLMSYIVDKQGYNVGFTSTDGIYLKDRLIYKGDCSGPKSTRMILQEPSVDFAVLECARGGIIRSGLAFDQCNVAIVTNVAADHLGQKDINTLEDLAVVKGVVPHSVIPDGYAILNAADDLVYKMKETLRCRIALFALDEHNIRIQAHCAEGGVAAFLDKDKNIVVQAGNMRTVIDNVLNIPLTMKGKADFMIENVLSTVLASYVLGFNTDLLKEAITSFIPSAEHTPGRMNTFEINDVNVIVDYAHNPHALNALNKMLKQIDTKKIGIVTGVGDRRDDDIMEVGRIAAAMYDEVIIRIDKDTRERTPDQISDLVIRGIDEVNKGIPHHLIPDSRDALRYAIDHADKGAYIIISADDVTNTINIMKELQSEFKKQ
jgi:cyanophycin synthetase